MRFATWLIDAGAERPAESADLLAATIGASDADVQDRAPLFLAWREVVELAAARRPLVLLVEDLHWSSDSLLDLIEYILQPRSDSAILMLALARPELLERRPTWGGGRRNHVSIALEPLDEESIGALVRGLLEGAAPELVRLVADRSEGNPVLRRRDRPHAAGARTGPQRLRRRRRGGVRGCQTLSRPPCSRASTRSPRTRAACFSWAPSLAARSAPMAWPPSRESGTTTRQRSRSSSSATCCVPAAAAS